MQIMVLNANLMDDRLRALGTLVSQAPAPVRGQDVNNHIHTTYSFSPYSPTMALYKAWQAGLTTAGIMDHDSIAGAREFIKAGEILGMRTTVGLECRADFSGTPLAGRRINNPDQLSIAYMAIHGVPHGQIEALDDWFKPYRIHRNIRNRAMLTRINSWVAPLGIASLDFDRDVLSLSEPMGTVTERHLLFALVRRILDAGSRQQAVEYVGQLGIALTEKVKGLILDPQNDMVEYDLLMALKSDATAFYIDATDECPDVRDILRLCEEIGAISAYAYLGDVGQSITGDKRAQAFEDSYMTELFDIIKDMGYRAVTYMPSRNTPQQLVRVREMCERYELMQISGEDINSPRQVFICAALRDPAFHNLIDNTYALIGHERRATQDDTLGMFRQDAMGKWPRLADRIAAFVQYGREVS